MVFFLGFRGTRGTNELKSTNAYSKKYAYVSKRIEKEPHSASCRRWRFHICSMMYECVNKQRRNPSRQEKGAVEKELVECLLSPYIYYNSSGLVGRVAGKTILFFVLFRPADFRVDRTDKHMPPFPLCMSSAEHRLIDVTHRLSEYTRCLTYGQFRS